jgi:hypothetical protein
MDARKCTVLCSSRHHRTEARNRRQSYYIWMEDAPVIAGLLAKRASIEGQIAELERDIRRRRAEVMQIDATILLFAPNLRRAKRDVGQP